VLLVRRADSGLFGGLWELPSVVLEEAQDALSAARELGGQAFRKPRGSRHAGRVAQALTHRDVEVDVFTTTGTGALIPEGGRWIDPAELATLGLSTLAVKVLVAAGVPVPEGHGRRRAPKAAGQGSLF